MPLFKLHRDHTLRTTKGYTITFVEGEPTSVPNMIVPDVVAIGGVLVEGEDAKAADVLPPKKEDTPPLTQEERREKIVESMRVLMERNDRGDFTGSGLPDRRKLNAMCGFDVTSRERDECWMGIKAADAEEL